MDLLGSCNGGKYNITRIFTFQRRELILDASQGRCCDNIVLFLTA